ncbi:MAG: YncE family protein [Acidobacteriota bacterium]
MKRVLLATFAAVVLMSQVPPALRPGALTDGTELLPTGWRIHPAGTQVSVGAFPLGSVTSPDGKFLIVANAGRPSSLSVVRTDTLAVVSTTPVPEAWQGITFSPDGRSVYAGGGAQNSVFELSFSAEGVLGKPKELPGASAGGFISDVAFPPAGRLLYAADMWHDEVLVFNPQSGRVIERFKSGRRPYQIVFHPNGSRTSFPVGQTGAFTNTARTRVRRWRVFAWLRTRPAWRSARARFRKIRRHRRLDCSSPRQIRITFL